ncbi:MAG TPA: lysophospholipid acyltransferase family protein [Tepidisphaeraceae bacterium]|jgi:1-acyl-sn-glycerol-3-phosphate acyltransferase
MYQFQYYNLAPSPHPAQTLLERLSRCPREPDLLCYAARAGSALLCRAWLKAYHRLTIIGRENLPASGPFVLVANHSSHLDTLCLLAALPMHKLHNTYPAAAADYFFTSVPRIAFAAVCINAMPFGRADHVRQTMTMCREILSGGENVLIVFPEGTRTTDGKVGAFRRGIGDLVAGRKVHVVPCHLEGAFEAMPRGRWFPRPRKLTLRIGSPMNFEDRDASKADAIEISAQLRDAVVALRAIPSPGTPGEGEGGGFEISALDSRIQKTPTPALPRGTRGGGTAEGVLS